MKINISLERDNENSRYKASLPISAGMPMQAEGDSPGEALSELGSMLDLMLCDNGWDALEESTRKK